MGRKAMIGEGLIRSKMGFLIIILKTLIIKQVDILIVCKSYNRGLWKKILYRIKRIFNLLRRLFARN